MLGGVDSLWPCVRQHTRLLCPLLFLGDCSDSCPLNWWCYLTILSSTAPFSCCLQPFPASGAFPKSQLLALDDQSIGALASATDFPMNIQGWFPLGLTGFISLQSKGLKSLLQWHNSKESAFWCSAFFMVQLSHPYVTTRKNIVLTIWTFVCKVMSLFYNMVSMFVIVFLSRSKHLLISWLESPSAVTLGPKKMKSVSASTFYPLSAMKWWDKMPWS